MPIGSGVPSASRSRAASSIAGPAVLAGDGGRRSTRLRGRGRCEDRAARGSVDGRAARLDATASRPANALGDLRGESGPSSRSRSTMPSASRARRSGARRCSSSSVCSITAVVQQLAQLGAAEQLGEQRRVEGQRGGPAFGQRGVALVHERGDVAEQQRAGERRRLLGLDLHDADAAALDLGGQLGQRGQVVDILQHLAHRLEHDREGRVLAATASSCAERCRCCHSGERLPGL